MQAAFLFELAIKATLVIVATWGVVRRLSRASAAARSTVWASGLTFLVLLPLFMAAAPSWSLDVVRVSTMGRAVGALVADLSIDEPPAREPLPDSTPLTVRISDAQARPNVASVAAIVLPLVSILWLIGTLVELARLSRGILMVRRMSRAAEPLEDSEWTAIVARGCAQLGLERTPTIRTSGDIDVPAVSGILQPMLLLPADCQQWSESCRRVVVLHELAHIQRRDCLIQFLTECAAAMYWFHPLIRSAASRVRHEREEACDDVVIAAGTSPTTYADHLLDLVRAGLAVPPAPAVAFGTPSRLNQRISAILDDTRCRTGPASRTVTAAILAGVVAVVTLGGARIMAQAGPAGHIGDHGGGTVTRVITAETRQRVRDALAAGLRDANEGVRSVAGTAIAAIQASGDAALRVETPCRANCVNWDQTLEPLQRAIMNLSDESALVRLASDDVEGRRAAVGQVWPRTQRGAAALTRALLDEDRIVRNGAAIRLDSVHALMAVPNWLVLLGDTDPMLRERAAISLGVIGDGRAIDPLAEALRDPESAVRYQAARALAFIALGGENVNAAMAGGALQARTVYRAEDGVTLPEVIREVRPSYTPEAMQARIQGGVVMRAVVEADGSVKDIEVVESLDTEHGLDTQATDALKKWAFKPGLWMGEPVPVLITVDMRFHLK
jgi:TonB family protein